MVLMFFMVNKYLKILNDIEIYNRDIDESAIIYISRYLRSKFAEKFLVLLVM
jgi:hypothetical protein